VFTVTLTPDAEFYTSSYTFFGNTVHYPSHLDTIIHYTNNTIAHNVQQNITPHHFLT